MAKVPPPAPMYQDKPFLRTVIYSPQHPPKVVVDPASDLDILRAMTPYAFQVAVFPHLGYIAAVGLLSGAIQEPMKLAERTSGHVRLPFSPEDIKKVADPLRPPVREIELDTVFSRPQL